MAGASCTDFSLYGHKLGEAGPQMVPFLVWISEVLTDLPDVVVFEITAVGTASLLKKYLGRVYNCMEFYLSPWLSGWPEKRPRQLAVATRISTTKFHGSPAEYQSLFECRVELDGSALLLASPQERALELRTMAANRGNHLDPHVTSIPLAWVLAPFSISCLERHRVFKEANPHRKGATGTYITDVDQSLRFCLGCPSTWKPIRQHHVYMRVYRYKYSKYIEPYIYIYIYGSILLI
jgi:hypothetical protein